MVEPTSIATVKTLIDQLFRRESGKMIATLTRLVGFHNIDLAEDMVQEALVKALRIWEADGIPTNPAGWLVQVARNLAIDYLRREKNFQHNKAPLLQARDGQVPAGDFSDELFVDSEIRDDQLRMMFTCSHPMLSLESRIALTLKTLCGFRTAEIARALLCKEAAVTKRITRAKERLRAAGVPFDVPAGAELSERLDAVLKVLYLMFNEGYNTSRGENLVRRELCDEAIRLTELLVNHPSGDFPRTRALLALMLFHGARLPARIDSDGNLLQLAEQDRSLWDKSMIVRGLNYIGRAAEGKDVSAYHFEAGIAACHCLAKDYASTDWQRILEHYDLLLAINSSPVVLLHRAVALAQLQGPAAGLQAVQTIPAGAHLDSYYLYYAVQGEFQAQLGNTDEALKQFSRALSLTEVPAERALLERKCAALPG